MIDAARLAKFKRRAKVMTSQHHVDAAMRTFPDEHHEEVAEKIQDKLKEGLIARKGEPMEIKPANPEAPTLHEDTVRRLNTMAKAVEDANASLKPFQDRIAELEAQNAEHERIIQALKDQRTQLQDQISESVLNKV